ncbi:MAG: FAD-binding oxidoreductase [Candidatus Paceibacterota bacterium]
MNLKKELKKIIKGEVDISKNTLEEYSTDASIFKVKPEVVIFPKDKDDLRKIINFVIDKKHKNKNISLTMRSGGTDMTGGPLNNSIIVDVNKYLNKVKKVEGSKDDSDLKANKFVKGYSVVEPGTYYRNFEAETLRENLLMPSYPASREICTVGGMVSNNSGGEKSLKYGKTEDYVAELKVILSDGNEYTFQPLREKQLEDKKAQNDFEGGIYRKVYKLLDDNYEIIKKAKPQVSKNSAGYGLWNIWDKDKGIFDMTQLFVGSQGTLGVISEIKYRLVEPEPYSKMLVMFLKNTDELAGVINEALKFKPESLESYDDKTLKLVFRYIFSFIKMMGFKNIFKLAWNFLPELGLVLKGGFPKLIILAEFTGKNEEEIEKVVKRADKAIKEFKSVSTHLVRNDLEAKKYWTIRREAFNLLRHHLKGEKSEPFIDDLIVRPELLPEFLPKLYQILDSYKKEMTYAIGGHSGDGNMHIYSIMDPTDVSILKVIEEVSKKVYDLVIEMGGSITAEHNDGLIRSPFLKQMYGEEIYKLFEDTKKIFDPENIFNPGKKVNSSFNYALGHFKDN